MIIVLKEVIMYGVVFRVRFKLMIFFSILVLFILIMYSYGIGFEIMKFIVVFMLGGMISSVVLMFFIIFMVYFVIKNVRVKGVRNKI